MRFAYRTTGCNTTSKKNGSSAATIETDDIRSYFLIDIPCHPDFVWEKQDFVVTNIELTARQKQIIEIMHAYDKVTQKTIAKHLNVSRQTIYKEFSILQKRDVIKHIGTSKYGYWIIVSLL